MVLENVKEMWTEKPKGGKGRGVNKDRFISKMYVFFVVLLYLISYYLFLYDLRLYCVMSMNSSMLLTRFLGSYVAIQ